MIHCRHCGGLGWLLALSPRGLCDACERLVTMETEQRSQALKDSRRRAETTLSPYTKLTQLDILVENLQALARYEEKGIPTIAGAAERLEEGRAERDRHILRTAGREFSAVMKTVRRTEDRAEKVRLQNVLLLKLKDYEDRLTRKGPLREMARRMSDSIARIRFYERMDEAVRAEEEGRLPEALQLYRALESELKARKPAPGRLEKLREKIRALSRGIQD